MRLVRPTLPAALVLLALTGCRTAGVDNLAARQAPLASRPQFDVQELVADHNRNAERIVSIQAKPSLSVSKGRRPAGGADGFLALERPRNFRLEVTHAGGSLADIGSNDQNFWIWIKDNDKKATYYCDYDETGNSPLSPATMQPDWITEALGLRQITAEEAAGITVTRDKNPDTLILTHRPIRAAGEVVTRVTVLSDSTRRVKQHLLYTGEPKVLLARASVEDYLEIKPADRPEETVYLPRKLKLEWSRERMTLDAMFAQDSTKVNEEIADETRTALFEEESHTGYDRVDLAKLSGVTVKRSQGPTTLRETLPAPPAGVELGEPAPLGIDGASRTEQDPIAISAERTSSLRDDLLVSPALPSAPEPRYARPMVSSRWRAASAMER